MWLGFSISNRNSEISLSSACTCLRPKKSIKANFPRLATATIENFNR